MNLIKRKSNYFDDLVINMSSKTLQKFINKRSTKPIDVAELLNLHDATEAPRSLLELGPGDMDYISKHRIREVILKDTTFIVYLNYDNQLIWSTEKYGPFPKDFGLVTSKATMLEHLAEKIFRKKDTTKFKYLIGEGLARVLDDKDTAVAMVALNDAEVQLKAEAKHILKTYYIAASIITTIIIIYMFFTIWVNRASLAYGFSSHAQHVVLASLCGGIGAFVSSFFRSMNFEGDVTIPNWVYSLDGFLRIFYGVIAGLIVILAIKSNLLLGIVNDQTNPSFEVLMFIAIIAGASESFIPSIIKKIEEKL